MKRSLTLLRALPSTTRLPFSRALHTTRPTSLATPTSTPSDLESTTTLTPSEDSLGFGLHEMGPQTAGRPIYLDMQATTPTDPRVLDAMLPFMTNQYGNPHSKTHAYGWETEMAVEEGRKVSSRFLLWLFPWIGRARGWVEVPSALFGGGRSESDLRALLAEEVGG